MELQHKQILKAIQSRQFQKAEKLCLTVLQKDPHDARIIYHLSLSYALQNKNQQALDTLQKNISILETTVYYHAVLKNLTFLNSLQNNLAAALSFAQECLQWQADDIVILNIMAYIHEKQNDLFTAYQAYSKVLEIDPENKTALNGAAYCLVRMDADAELAKGLIRDALRQDPQNPAYLDTAGMVLLKLGKKDKARKMLELALEKLPRSQEIRDHIKLCKSHPADRSK